MPINRHHDDLGIAITMPRNPQAMLESNRAQG
jgi:hypothetical protein